MLFMTIAVIMTFLTVISQVTIYFICKKVSFLLFLFCVLATAGVLLAVYGYFKKQDSILEDAASKIEAFLVPAGTTIEVYATTLHYAPCTAAEGGFRCVVILPAGTNTELTFPAGKSGEDRLITAKNKWLIAHEEAGIDGAFCGLRGENITLA